MKKSEKDIIQTIKGCFNEFQQYDALYSERALSSLLGIILPTYGSQSPESRLAIDLKPSGDFEFLDYDEDGNAVDVGLSPFSEVYVGEEFLAHPAYELCSPTARNINVGDDEDYMPFVPFGDDPSFDFAPYNESHSSFSWQFFRPDPDLQMIAIEAARILLEKVGYTPQALDKIGFYPVQHPAYATPAIPRLVNIIQRRDFPTPLPPRWSLELQHSPENSKSGPSEIIETLIGSFCQNLNCLTGYCATHLDPIPPPIPPPLTTTREAMLLLADRPCGTDCFLTPMAVRDINSVALWTDGDRQLLGKLLLHSPDALPCDLAIICRRPCFEVSKYRNEHFGVLPASKDRAAKRKATKPSAMLFADSNAMAHTPNEPCSHTGACNAQSDCKCVKNDAHCTHSCRCDQKCPRQWKGCNCISKSGRCIRGRCSCRSGLRECDPRICHGGIASGSLLPDANAELPCCNMSIQFGLQKKTKVLRSKWGMGLFIMEDAQEGELIMEYTGELVYGPTTLSRDIVAQHRGRLYLFQLNSLLFIDSALAGNEARFINHNSLSNCEASILNVAGEHRIGFYATMPIKKGTEIVLNYGSEFFNHDRPKTSSKQQQVKKKKVKRSRKSITIDEPMSDVSYHPSPSPPE